jgi:hypothetical protein
MLFHDLDIAYMGMSTLYLHQARCRAMGPFVYVCFTQLKGQFLSEQRKCLIKTSELVVQILFVSDNVIPHQELI